MTNKKILIVDDEPSIRFLLSTIVQQAGYTVDVAEDGFSALRKMQDSKPDLVITDLRMPNMNGFELLSVIRGRFPEIPTVAVSGEFLACSIDQGPLADAFFQKGNYSIPDFLGKISDLLQSPSEHRRRAAHAGSIWTPTRDAPVMLTCAECLRSFPIDPCDMPGADPRRTTCIFCGEQLDVQLVAVGLAAASNQ
jgi:CheY-like chemotaxis protein